MDSAVARGLASDQKRTVNVLKSVLKADLEQFPILLKLIIYFFETGECQQHIFSECDTGGGQDMDVYGTCIVCDESLCVCEYDYETKTYRTILDGVSLQSANNEK